MILDRNSLSEMQSPEANHVNGDSYMPELQSYLCENIKDDPNFDLTQWWESHRDKYPNLLKLYLKYGLIPGTSSVVESEFSLLG